MRAAGYSTGALAFGDFRRALGMLKSKPVSAVELSALRLEELAPLIRALDDLDLSQFRHISVHAPSRFAEEDEPMVVRLLGECTARNWPIIVHPDAVHRFERWERFGGLLYLANMGKRKPIGRNAPELERLFTRLPEANLCFDIAHARQVDSTMLEAYYILREFRERVKQVHISEVSVGSHHGRLSWSAVRSFQEV